MVVGVSLRISETGDHLGFSHTAFSHTTKNIQFYGWKHLVDEKAQENGQTGSSE